MTSSSLHDSNLEYDYRILEKLESQPDISQRELAEHLGISVGKANFVLSALIARGLVKAENFKKSNNKAGYLYLLTPKGIAEKVGITRLFLAKKQAEYERLKAEIERIQNQIHK